MTMPSKPKSNSTRQQERFDLLNNPKHVLIGSVILLVFVLITVALMMSMTKTAHQAAERAWLKMKEATTVGHLVQHNVPKATVLFNNTGYSPALMTKVHLVMKIWPSNEFPDWETPLNWRLTVKALVKLIRAPSYLGPFP